jgi:Tol biopolymer transport system component
MNLWLFDLAAGRSRRMTSGAGGDYQPTWSPDGRRLTFFSSRAGSPDVWILDVANGELERVTTDPGVEINPFFSPDGRRIAYQGDATGRFELWMVDLESGERRQLSQQGVMTHFLRWLGDGRELLARCECGGASRVQRFALDGAPPVDEPAIENGYHISLLPGERAVVEVIGHKTLWRFPLGGEGKAERLFAFDDPAVRIDYPVVSPDGRWLLFDRLEPQGADIWQLRPAAR